MAGFLHTLRDFWSLVDGRARARSAFLVLLLIFNSIFEMFSVVFLFGYIAAVSGLDAGTVIVSDIYNAIDAYFDGINFVIAAGVFLISVFVLKNAASLIVNFYLMRFVLKRYDHVVTNLFEGFLNAKYEDFISRETTRAMMNLGSVASVFSTARANPSAPWNAYEKPGATVAGANGLGLAPPGAALAAPRYPSPRSEPDSASARRAPARRGRDRTRGSIGSSKLRGGSAGQLPTAGSPAPPVRAELGAG